jgi:hypothetical protein
LGIFGIIYQLVISSGHLVHLIGVGNVPTLSHNLSRGFLNRDDVRISVGLHTLGPEAMAALETEM